MITPWEVYLFTRLDSIISLCWVGVLCAVIMFIVCIFHIEQNDDEPTAFSKRWSRRAIVLLSISLIIGHIVPNTKEAVVIYLLPKIANNEQVQKLPENFVVLLNSKMEEWIAGFEQKGKKKE